MADRKSPRRSKRQMATRNREQFWRQVLQEQRTSGLGHSEFCRQKGLSTHAYFWWKRQIPIRDGKASPPRRTLQARSGSDRRESVLAAVRVVEPRSNGSRDGWSYEVVLERGRVVRVPPDFKPECLKQLIAVLEESC